jgi:primosomal protein N' (replication factor Y)
MCTLGEVMLAALPGTLVLSSATRLITAPDVPTSWTGDARHDLILDALEQRHELSLAQAGELLNLKDPMPVIKKLLDSGALMRAEELETKYTPRSERFVRLTPEAREEAALHRWFDVLERAPKQLHLLMRYIELSRCLSGDPREVKRDQLLRSSNASAAELKRLCQKGVFAIEERPAGAPSDELLRKPPAILSEAQAKALAEVRAGFEGKEKRRARAHHHRMGLRFPQHPKPKLGPLAL